MLPWDQDPTLAAFPKTPADGQLPVLETRAKIHAMPWHRQKLTLIVSSVRHFVEERRAAGFHVEHRLADDYASGVAASRRSRSGRSRRSSTRWRRRSGPSTPGFGR
ncbi:MAG: cryptochrome/photolyase family protein [Myxococcaceae bacterium]|nr:cryptochrome/photolyase family protein [Myxococcaceae bacterium]MCA3010934.1 cryptochrome/photolyase family protein [Myxococcaceae bacterium]